MMPTGGASKSIAFTPDGTFLVRTLSHAGNPRDNLIIHRVDNWSVVWGLRTYQGQRIALLTSGEQDVQSLPTNQCRSN